MFLSLFLWKREKHRDLNMANKKSIQDVDAALDRWMRKLRTATRKVDELWDLRRRLILGKIKHPPPKGVKYKISVADKEAVAQALEEFDDPIPSFGSTPAIGG